MLSPYVPIPSPNGVIFVNSQNQHTSIQTSSWPSAWGSQNTDIVYVQDLLYWYSLQSVGWELVFVSPLPEHFEALSIFFWNQLILIGGKGGQTKIICIDTTSRKTIEVEHPNILKKFRKSIDDFFVWNDLLYAVDNHIHPKYILGYRFENSMLCFVEKKQLISHASEERVKSGLIWNNTLVMLSVSAHRLGTTSFVSFYPNLEFSSYLCWHKVIGMSETIVEIKKIIKNGEELLFLTNLGLARWKMGQKEEDIELVCPNKKLIDVYVWPNEEWWGIEKDFAGQKKQILLQGTGVL